MILIDGITPIRIVDVPGYRLKAAVTKSMGQPFLLDLREVISKRITPLQDDTQAISKAGLNAIESGIMTTLTPDSDEDVCVVCYYYPENDDSGLRSLLIERACLTIGQGIGQLIHGFNDQRNFLYECFPELRGKIRSGSNLQGVNAVITSQQKKLAVRKYLATQTTEMLALQAKIDSTSLIAVSNDFIEDKVGVDSEFPLLRPVTLMASNQKPLCTGYVGSLQEQSFTHVGNVRVYFPDQASEYYICIIDTGDGADGGGRFDTRVIESVEEVEDVVRESHGDVKLYANENVNDIESHYQMPSFTTTVGRAQCNFIKSSSTIVEMKEVCKSLGIAGYSGKDRDQLTEMIAEFLTVNYENEQTLYGNYMTRKVFVRNDEGNVPDIVGRISADSVYLADRECIIPEVKLNTCYEVVDILNPYEAGFQYVSDDYEEDSRRLREANRRATA